MAATVEMSATSEGTMNKQILFIVLRVLRLQARRCLILLAVAASANACKKNSASSGTATAPDAVTPIASAPVALDSVDQDRPLLRLIANASAAGTATLTAITAAEGALTVTQTALDPSTTAVEIGTITFSRISFEVNGVTNCVKDLNSTADALCDGSHASTPPPLPNPTPMPLPVLPPPTPILSSVTPLNPTPMSTPSTPTPIPTPSTPMPPTTPEIAKQDPTASSFTHSAIIHDGMKCGGHYQDGAVWQKSFDVGISADVASLAAVTRVVYDVFSAYTGNPFTVSDPSAQSGLAFATTAGFLTPVTSWSTNGATVYLKNGKSLKLPGAAITWSDDDATRKAYGGCVP